MSKHWAIFTDNNSNKKSLIQRFLKREFPQELSHLTTKKGALFSKISLAKFLDEEDKHGINQLENGRQQALKTMSSGEQKKALFQYLIKTSPDFIILDNPFDNLDAQAQLDLVEIVTKRSTQTIFIQLLSRQSDLLTFITNFAYLNGNHFSVRTSSTVNPIKKNTPFPKSLPRSIYPINVADPLIQMKDINVSFGNKTVLQNIHWTINKGEFWQLIGKNGSGKTTLLSMLTGENPKGYGQELFLFGNKKGSGESIWDIKKNIGYFSPAMTYKFKGRHTIENMLISGLNDSIGLYIKPTEGQLRLAKDWLIFLDLLPMKDHLFNELTAGQQRLIMIARATIKHPPLLILDEPTTGLDDLSAKLVVHLVNRIGVESDTAILFVSHREESGLTPNFIYKLEMTENGSFGDIKYS